MDELRPGSQSKSKDLGIIQAGTLRELQVTGPQEGLRLLPRLQDPQLRLSTGMGTPTKTMEPSNPQNLVLASI